MPSWLKSGEASWAYPAQLPIKQKARMAMVSSGIQTLPHCRAPTLTRLPNVVHTPVLGEQAERIGNPQQHEPAVDDRGGRQFGERGLSRPTDSTARRISMDVELSR